MVTVSAYTGDTTKGVALDAGKMAAETDTAGSFSFKESTLEDGMHSYHWTFTPAGEGYVAVTGEIEITSTEHRTGCGSRAGAFPLIALTACAVGAVFYGKKPKRGDVSDKTKIDV